MTDKTILIVGEEQGGQENNKYNDATLDFGDGDRVVVSEISNYDDGSKLRGYMADLVILTEPISQEVMQNVIRPIAVKGEIIELY